MNELAPFGSQAWESFYVIVGSSAGALTGLQFVVMTLIAQTGLTGRSDALSGVTGAPRASDDGTASGTAVGTTGM